MKMRQKKTSQNPQKPHPQYMAGAQKTWVDEEREKNMKPMKRLFWSIIGVCVLIAIILVMAFTSYFIAEAPVDNTHRISAADTFAVSQKEQQQMQESSKTFATGLLLNAYCSDKNEAEKGKQAALSCMADGTESEKTISSLSNGAGVIAPENFIPIIEDPVLVEGSQNYAGKYTYTFNGAAADSSIKDGNQERTLADAGYSFSLTFEKAASSDGGNALWMISSSTVTPK